MWVVRGTDSTVDSPYFHPGDQVNGGQWFYQKIDLAHLILPGAHSNVFCTIILLFITSGELNNNQVYLSVFFLSPLVRSCTFKAKRKHSPNCVLICPPNNDYCKYQNKNGNF